MANKQFTLAIALAKSKLGRNSLKGATLLNRFKITTSTLVNRRGVWIVRKHPTLIAKIALQKPTPF